jgi:hypothetical protein
MYDAVVSILISFASWVVTSIDGAWETIAPPEGVLYNLVAWLWTLDNWFPVSDTFIIAGMIGGVALFVAVIKFAMKLVDWLPKGV